MSCIKIRDGMDLDIFLEQALWPHYNKQYLEFDKARAFVRSLEFKNVTEWREYCKSGRKPDNISGSPHNTYKNKGWISYGDWLGTGRVADGTQKWLAFDDARDFAKRLNLKGKEDWEKFARKGKKPKSIPSAVARVYKGPMERLGLLFRKETKG